MAEHTKNPFAALALSPAKTFMEVQDQGEDLSLLVRRHPIVNIRWMVTSVILAFIPVVIFSDFGINYLDTQSLFVWLSPKTIDALILLWYLSVYLYILQHSLLWFFNVLIVTNERIVDLDVTWPFHRTVSETRISQVQDVSFKQGGFLGSILNYGGVHIQTAGAEQNIEITKAPNPALIHDRITDIVSEFGDS